MDNEDVRREMARKTRRSLLTGGLAALAGGSIWEWIRTRRQDDGEPWPLRVGLRVDEQLARDYFSENRAVATFSASDVQPGRPNGKVGLDGDPDPNWKLTLEDIADGDDPVELGIDQIKALPKTEMITELKCIEGWRRVLHWGGVRFRDLVAHYQPEPLSPNAYIGMETPDGEYYVGLDMPSALHPQTLLAYEMNGKPLEAKHGAPLRLVIPVKYGIKNLKRIGKISYQEVRPKDYWAEDGYDWYAGF
jgi:hypothetical protein